MKVCVNSQQYGWRNELCPAGVGVFSLYLGLDEWLPSLHSWCTLLMVLGQRPRPTEPISPSKRLVLLFWVFVGEALVWSFVAVRKPTKPLGTAKELWTMWTTLSLYGHMRRSGDTCCLPAIPESATRTDLFLRTQQRAWWRLRCCHARFHSLLGSQGGTSLLMSPQAHSSTHGATVFVLVFSYPNFK